MINEQIIKNLYILCDKLNRPVSKKDLPSENIPYSYNTILRRGIKFSELKFIEYLYLKQGKSCIYCKKKLSFTEDYKYKKFCNSSCSLSFHRPMIQKISKHPHKHCFSCKKYIGRQEKNYCNRECYFKDIFMLKFLSWYYGEKFKEVKTIKEFLITIYGYKCSKCGINKHNGKHIVLQLEHINGNALDNTKENVCLLCPNCHSQTPTYSGRNKGNGKRIWRKERYRLGKSC